MSKNPAVAHGLAEVLVFEVAGQRYGLPGASVCELVRAVHITPLPRQPDFALGVINLRGQIVPVLDLRKWLGLPAKALEPADHFLVTRVGRRLVALRVDRALELAPLAAGALDQADGMADADVGNQVAKLPGGLVLIPNLENFLAPCAAARLEEELAGAPPMPGAEGRQP
jgi:purine-binding chemotaxis protein CheW